MPSNDGPGQDNLQFDRAVSATGDAATQRDAIVCAACNAPVRTWYYYIEGAPHCAGCKQKAERSSGPVRDWGLTLRATLFGLGAAIAGAIVYYGVIAITNFEIGIVALLIGWMVGRAMRAGASGRGGRRLQFTAAGLTYFAVALAYLPLVMKGASDSAKEALETAALVADSAQETSGAPNAVPESETEAPPFTAANANVNPLFAFAALIAFTFGLPVMVIFATMPSGLISALIIAIGMQQAWKMTGATSLSIAGPFKVGRTRDADNAAAA